MNDDLLNYQPKQIKEPKHMDKEITLDKERPAPSSGEGKISTIFLIVLGLHILVIIGISAHYLMKGSRHGDTAKTSTEEQQTTPPTDAATPSTADAGKDLTPPSLDQSAAAQASTTLPDKTQESGKMDASPEDYLTKGNPTPIAPEAAVLPPLHSGAPTDIPSLAAKSSDATLGQAPASPATPAEPAAAATSQGEYTVVKGDTLTRIAHKMGVKIAALKEANKLSNDFLKIGQKLALPAGAKIVASAPVAAPAAIKHATGASKTSTPAVVSNGSYASHEVAKGETLTKIARMYGTSANKLAKLNDITDPKKLKIGMKLRVPAQASAAASTTASVPPTPAVDTSTTNAESEPDTTASTTAPATSFKTTPEHLAMLRPGESNK